MLMPDIITSVSLANSEFRHLVEGGQFSFVNCMPTVHMQCVDEDDYEMLEHPENIRICVVKFDNYDYTKNYRKLLDHYKNGKIEISHLVALYITSHQQKIKFEQDASEEFDAIISVGLDSLTKVLLAIMFDISLYHYFLLSDGFEQRRDFNRHKYKYVSELYGRPDQEELFGGDLPLLSDDIGVKLYLPISWAEVKPIKKSHKDESRQKAIGRMLQTFANFLADELSLGVLVDAEGKITNCSAQLPEEISDIVKKTVCEQKDADTEYLMIFFEDSTKLLHLLEEPLVQFKKDGKFPCWINKSHEGKGLRYIVRVRREDGQK